MHRTERFTVDGPVRLDVRIVTGEVTVRAGGTDQVSVALDADQADEVDVSLFGGTVAVRYDSRRRFRGHAVYVVVDVPEGSDVDVATTSARIRLTGRLGTARLRTTTGDLDVDHVARLDATTASASITAQDVDGDASCTTVSGDVLVRRVGGRWSVSTAAGDVRADDVTGDVEVVTTAGDVQVDRCSGADIAVRSVAGDVAVCLPPGIRVNADLSTLSGRTRLPEPSATTSSDDDAARREVRLRLRTVSGDIRVDRADPA